MGSALTATDTPRIIAQTFGMRSMGHSRCTYWVYLFICLVGATPDLARAQIRPLADVHAGGYLRTRFLGLYNTDLGNGGYSGVDAPLLDQYANEGLGGADDFASSFTGRLRLDLNFDMGDGLAAVATMDVIDRYLFGSPGHQRDTSGAFPVNQGGDMSASLFRVKQLYGVIRPFRHLELRAGRQAFGWGLGMLHNDGRGLDADAGGLTDGITTYVRALDYELGFSWDFAFEGPVSGTRYDTEGQPHELDGLDDVGQWRLHVLQRTDTWEWGILNVFRTQDLSSEQARWQSYGEAFCAVSGDPVLGLNPDCYTLVPRGYFLWSPDVYVKLQVPELFSIEAEAALSYGSIDHATNSAVNDVSTDILAFGALLRAQLHLDSLHLALESAVASGSADTPRAFGDGYDPEGLGPEAYRRWNERDSQNLFFFARDAHMDLLLFRQILGAFTNALLIAAPVELDVLHMGEHRLSVGAKPIFSMAFNDLTPLGLEADVWAQYHMGEAFRLQVEGAWLQPLEGLNNPYTNQEASPAFTVQAKAWWIF